VNKIITVLYVLYFVSYMLGCTTKGDYEMRFWMDRGSDEINGHVIIDGEKHPIKVKYND